MNTGQRDKKKIEGKENRDRQLFLIFTSVTKNVPYWTTVSRFLLQGLFPLVRFSNRQETLNLFFGKFWVTSIIFPTGQKRRKI